MHAIRNLAASRSGAHRSAGRSSGSAAPHRPRRRRSRPATCSDSRTAQPTSRPKTRRRSTIRCGCRKRRTGLDDWRQLPRHEEDPDDHRDVGPQPAPGAGERHRPQQGRGCSPVGRQGVQRVRLRGEGRGGPGPHPGRRARAAGASRTQRRRAAAATRLQLRRRQRRASVASTRDCSSSRSSGHRTSSSPCNATSRATPSTSTSSTWARRSSRYRTVRVGPGEYVGQALFS